MFKKIKGEWSRQEHFSYYLNNVRCTYSLTVQLDITKLHLTLKKRGLKVYPAQLYVLASVVNSLPEFRLSLSDTGEPGYWDVLHPLYTIFNQQTKTFSNIWTCYEQEFSCFYQAVQRDIAKYSQTVAFVPQKELPANLFNVSSLPWLDFTAFNLNVYTEGSHLLPIFTMGRYTEHEGKTLLPLAMQLHHAACDGYHAGQFVKALRNMLEDCQNWLGSS